MNKNELRVLAQDLNKQQAEFNKEMRKRLSVSAEIIRNLYFKHFHNYSAWSSIPEFAWREWYNHKDSYFIYEQGQTYLVTPHGKKIKIESVYFSNNVREIAKYARRHWYAAIEKQYRESVEQENRLKRELERRQTEYAEIQKKNASYVASQEKRRAKREQNLQKKLSK